MLIYLHQIVPVILLAKFADRTSVALTVRSLNASGERGRWERPLERGVAILPKAKSDGARGKGRAGHGQPGRRVDYEETVAAVCKYFCRGYLPADIADLMQERYGVEMSREAPYKYIQYAAAHNWLQFLAPREDQLSQTLRTRYPWLQQAEVVHTSVVDDVAYRAAVMVVELLRAHCRRHKEVVHIGFTGGYSMRTVAETLAALLQQPTDNLPKTVVFHTLVAGFDVDTPVTDPNAFLTYFVRPAMQVDTRFVLLHAPAMVEPEEMPKVLALPGVEQARQSVHKLDLIVTSAAVINDPHSMLARYYDEPTRDLLTRDGCVGDMLWWPLARHGPLDPTKYPYRSLTLLELSELPDYIQRGTQVLLALGPCGKCGELKTDILETLLHLDDHLLTHLVVDSRTARALFERVPSK